LIVSSRGTLRHSPKEDAATRAVNQPLRPLIPQQISAKTSVIANNVRDSGHTKFYWPDSQNAH
jgi:hypothetical protein